MVSINEVTRRRARLVLGWVTVFLAYHLGVITKPHRPTPPPILNGMGIEYRPKGGVALQLGMAHSICG